MNTVTRTPADRNAEVWTVAEIWTVDPGAVHKLEAATGFHYDSKLDTWSNQTGQSPDGVEVDLGFCAFYLGTVSYGDLLTADMRHGWLEADGYECYQSEMLREEMESQRYAWLS